MGLKIKERNDNQYLYFDYGHGKGVYLGKVGEITKYPERVTSILDIIFSKYSNHLEAESKLISMLPEKERKQYANKRISELKKIMRSLK